MSTDYHSPRSHSLLASWQNSSFPNPCSPWARSYSQSDLDPFEAALEP